MMRGRDFSSFARTVASLAMSAIFLFAVIIFYTAVFYDSVSSGFFAPSFTEAITFIIPSILIGLADLYIIAFLAALVHQKRSVFLLVLSVLGIIMIAPCVIICMTAAFTKTIGAIYIFLIPIAFTLTSAAFITASFISNHSHWQWL
ncbi:MAG TPA: hypothetical protein DEQ02_08530 [Ruminococcaceae bacterium]|nr:hypothetical protein [Oscillospiraceae bacterium]